MADKDFDFGLVAPGVFGEEPDPNELNWYAYLLENGKMKIRRYLSWGDYKEAGDSDFVRHITRIFPAKTWEEATSEAKRQIRNKM